jgi:GT2 family glycosyltransferase
MTSFELHERAATASDLPLMKIRVCILTYLRPALLRQALASVARQTVLDDDVLISEGGTPLCRVYVDTLVVDNDPEQSARENTLKTFERHGLRGRYVSEPRRGLSVARNRALDESADADFVVFLDDDEAANHDWLLHLVRAAITYEADVVTGPVDAQHIASPQWVVRGGFFSPARRPTGSPVRWVASNNTLLSNTIVREFRFDRAFDSTGGEDTEFFLRVGKAGYRMVWVEEARVSEAVPSSRANLKWLLQRAWSDANRFTLGVLATEPGLHTRVRRAITACGGMLTGIALLPCACVGVHHGVRGLQLVSRSCGTLSALRGQRRSYYGSTRE